MTPYSTTFYYFAVITAQYWKDWKQMGTFYKMSYVYATFLFSIPHFLPIRGRREIQRVSFFGITFQFKREFAMKMFPNNLKVHDATNSNTKEW